MTIIDPSDIEQPATQPVDITPILAQVARPEGEAQ
jgi:hypothetical protein